MGFLPIFLYVAVVSDNDGSAFITKAEFDSLKNNFQAQIDNYNQSIDSKIDGAIASYLAGIKVNTDDTPEFRVYGADYGIWNGKKCNGFYLTAGGSGTYDSTTNHFFLDGSTVTNRGYGYAYWIRGLQDDGKLIHLTEKWAYIQDNLDYSFLAADWSSKRLYWATWTGSTTTASNYMTNVDYTRLANRDLSDVFQQMVSPYCPTIKLIEFLDSGEATLSFAFVLNGYVYEGGASGGKDGYPTFMGGQASDKSAVPRNTNGGTCRLRHMRGDTALADLWICENIAEKNWTSKTINVNAGDTLSIYIKGSDTGANRGTYSIYWFANEIPGWKLATT